MLEPDALAVLLALVRSAVDLEFGVTGKSTNGGPGMSEEVEVLDMVKGFTYCGRGRCR
jgi:hypothetical protein